MGCGCMDNPCACVLRAGDGVTVTGTGTPVDPWIVTSTGGGGSADVGWYFAAGPPSAPLIVNSGGSAALTASGGDDHFEAAAGRWAMSFQFEITPNALGTAGQVCNAAVTVGDLVVTELGTTIQIVRSGLVGTGDSYTGAVITETSDLAVPTTCGLVSGLTVTDLLTGDPIDATGWSLSYFCTYVRTDI